jgi:hypothetical protein
MNPIMAGYHVPLCVLGRLVFISPVSDLLALLQVKLWETFTMKVVKTKAWL